MHDLETRIPEFIALMLAAGGLYFVAAFLASRFALGRIALGVILLSGVAFRLQFLSVQPAVSDDVYRYQWEGRIERAGLNPYSVYPDAPGMQGFMDPAHPILTGSRLPSIYPPLSEVSLATVRSVAGYKRLFTAIDLANIGVILLLLGALKLPLHRVVIYAWNPAVLVSFAMSAHNDALAVLALLVATYFIIKQRPKVSILFLALATLSKLFPAALLPIFLKRARIAYFGIFAAVVAIGYLPVLSAGQGLFKGLTGYARGWEGNDSLFRLIQAAGNTKLQAELVAGVLLLGIVFYALKKRLDPLRSSLLILSGLLFLSPNAFPWYFTWFAPFLCFEVSPPLMLVTVTCILGYSPVITYAAGVSFNNQPLMLALEYLPAFAWLAWQGRRATGLNRDQLR